MKRNRYYFYYNKKLNKVEIRYGLGFDLQSNIFINNLIADFHPDGHQGEELTRDTLFEDHVEKESDGQAYEPSLADKFVGYINSCLEDGSMRLNTCQDCGCKFITLSGEPESEYCKLCVHKYFEWDNLLSKGEQAREEIEQYGVSTQKYLVLDYIHDDKFDIDYFWYHLYKPESLDKLRLTNYRVILSKQDEWLMYVFARYLNRCKVGSRLCLIKCRMCGRYSVLTAHRRDKLYRAGKKESAICSDCYDNKYKKWVTHTLSSTDKVGV